MWEPYIHTSHTARGFLESPKVLRPCHATASPPGACLDIEHPRAIPMAEIHILGPVFWASCMEPSPFLLGEVASCQAHGTVLFGKRSPPSTQINWGRAKRSLVKFSPRGFQSSGLLLLSHFIIMNNKEILTHGFCKLFIACTEKSGQ